MIKDCSNVALRKGVSPNVDYKPTLGHVDVDVPKTLEVGIITGIFLRPRYH